MAVGQGARVVEKVLEESQLTGQLKLTGRGLRQIPPYSSRISLCDLLVADLSRNRLAEVPAQLLEKGSCLEELLLYQNNIRQIADDIGRLATLNVLNLSRNQLRYLPAAVCRLPLQVLIVSFNKLVSLPEEIGQLAELAEMDVHCNEISQLPVTLTKLRQLVSLDLCRNSLQCLPDDISNLASLRRLDVSDNQLSQLPLQLRLMRQLQLLNVAGNPLQLPAASACRRGRLHIFKLLELRAQRDRLEERARRCGAQTTHSRLSQMSVCGSEDMTMVVSSASTAGAVVSTARTPTAVAMVAPHCRRDARHSLAVVPVASSSSSSTSSGCASVYPPPAATAAAAAARSSPVKWASCTPVRGDLKDHPGEHHAPLAGSVVAGSDHSADVLASRNSITSLSSVSASGSSYSTRQMALQSVGKAVQSSVQQLRDNSGGSNNTTSSPPPLAAPLPILPPPPPPSSSASDLRQLRRERQCVDKLRQNIETRLGISLPDDLREALSDGVVLCHLANHVRPRAVPSVHVPSPAVPRLTEAKCRRNLQNFLDACRLIGVEESQLCSVSDMHQPHGLASISATVARLLNTVSDCSRKSVGSHSPLQSIV